MAAGGAGIPNHTRTPLPGRQEEAAALVAADDLTDEEIAAKIGVKKDSIERWKRRDDFSAAVLEYREAFKDAALTSGFADKRARLKALDALAFDLMGDMGKPATSDEPKGTYRKEIKLSANGEAVEYVVYDKAKADSFRGYLDDIAKELGERATRQEITGAGGEPLVLTVVGVDVERV